MSLRRRGSTENFSQIFTHSAGFSYIEVLIAVAVIGVCLVPAMDALKTGIQSTDVHESTLVDHYALQAKMEEVLAESFSSLAAASTAAGSLNSPTSYSDPSPFITTDGRQIVRQVYIWPYDGDNADSDNDSFTGTDADLLHVKVQINDSPLSLETLTTP
jgi:prepilin-type N-terminal cleavage/methylation domain-containing protein